MTPSTVAIIFDGNGRWAQKRRHPPIFGHTRGASVGLKIIDAAFRRGCSDVAVWVGSKSNFDKRLDEMQGIASIMIRTLSRRARTNEQGRLHVCGNWRERLQDKKLEHLVDSAERDTVKYRARNLWLLFGYDAESDDEQAALAVHEKGLPPTKENIRAHLWTAGLPQVDLLIRTGCENDPHDSDPFLWRHRQDTVLFYSPVLWPDFTVKHLDDAFDEYHRRPRRRGGREDVVQVPVAAE